MGKTNKDATRKIKAKAVKRKKAMQKAVNPDAKNPVGRPTAYCDEYCEMAYKLALLKVTDEQLADFFEVHVDTIYEWKKVYPKFSESLRAGKDEADSEVAKKLMERACGYEWFEEVPTKVKTVFWKDGKKFEEEKVIVTRVKRVVPPDTPAISLWLSNRTKNWHNKAVVDVTPGKGFFDIPKDASAADAAKAYQDAVKNL